MLETKIKSKTTVSKLKKILRNIYLETFILNSEKIGGPRKTVEVDETILYKKSIMLE